MEKKRLKVKRERERGIKGRKREKNEIFKRVEIEGS